MNPRDVLWIAGGEFRIFLRKRLREDSRGAFQHERQGRERAVWGEMLLVGDAEGRIWYDRGEGVSPSQGGAGETPPLQKVVVSS